MKRIAFLMASSGIALAGLFAIPASAHAAEQEAQADGAIADIIVTAQRRDESLQKTSVVLDVLSRAEMSRAGVTRVEDITRLSPGVLIATTTASPQIYVRGVGDFASTSISNPAVAVSVDGVYVARLQSLPADMYDFERIEVLKGPQGTLYGRNASGGAINIITAKPQLGKFGGRFSTEMGNYDAVTTSLAVNLPIGETFAVRVAGNYVRRDGFTNDGFGDASSEAVRVRALWQPSSAVSLMVNGSAGHVGGRGPANVIASAAMGGKKFISGTSAEGRAYIGARTFPPLAALVALPDGSDAHQDMDFRNVSAQLDVDMGFATLTVIPAYRDTKMFYNAYPFVEASFGAPLATAPARPDIPARPEKSEATSAEVRLSNAGDKFKWVVGAFYYNENQNSQYRVNGGVLLNNGIVSDLYTKAYAGFAQATYSLTPQLRAIGGIRYTSDRRELRNGQTFALAPSFLGFDSTPAPIISTQPILVESYQGRRTFDNVSWKAGVEYDLSPDSMFFATASSGFKAGGFNQLAYAGGPVNGNTATAFEPEKLYSYDIGLKNRLFGNRLQLNLGAFYWDYRNQQINHFTINSAGAVGIEFVNAQKAEIYGGNIDLIAKPWTGGTFTAAAEYTHARYKKFVYETANLLPGASGCVVGVATPLRMGPNGPIQSVDCSGHPVARAPEWTGSAGFNQEVPVGNAGTVSLSADMTFATARDLTFDYVAATRVGGYAMFNAGVSFSDPDNRFTLMGFVRNLTNREVFTGAEQPTFAPNTALMSVALPRTYGIRFEMNF